MTIKNIRWDFKKDFKKIIPNFVYNHLKKIAETKRNSDITVCIKGKHVSFIGADFEYTCKVIAGGYINVDGIIGSNENDVDFEVKVSAKELLKIAKEYNNDSSVKFRKMYLVATPEDVTTAYVTDDFRTMDKLDSETIHINEDKGNLTYCINPKYIEDAMKLFGDEMVSGIGRIMTLTSGYNGSGILFKNQTFTTYILPISSNLPTSELYEFLRIS